jgi:hypothetical protein
MGKTRTVNPFKNAEKPKPKIVEPIVEKLDKDGDIIFDTQVLDGIEEMLIQKEIKEEKKKKKGKVKRITRVDTSSEGENNENKG